MTINKNTLQTLYTLFKNKDFTVSEMTTLQDLVQTKLDDPLVTALVLNLLALKGQTQVHSFVYNCLLNTEIPTPRSILTFAFLHHTLNDDLVVPVSRLIFRSKNTFNEMYHFHHAIMNYRRDVRKQVGINIPQGPEVIHALRMEAEIKNLAPSVTLINSRAVQRLQT